MSTYYGYACKTCKKVSPHWINHGELMLLDILKRKDVMLEVASLQYVEIHILGVYGEFPTPLEFIRRHNGHEIIVVDEYDLIQIDYIKESEDVPF